MNNKCMEKLVIEINNCINNEYDIKDDTYTIESKDFFFKKLACTKEFNNNQGFMVFTEPLKSKIKKFGDYQYNRRYYYVEKLQGSGRNIIFVLFNCSTSSPDGLDPTVKNCKFLANKYKYARIEVLNLFSIRNATVNDINKIEFQNDKGNFNFIIELLKNRVDDCDVVLAWGYGKESNKKRDDKIKRERNGRKQTKNDFIIDIIDKFKNEIKKSGIINLKQISVDSKKTKDLRAMHPGHQIWNSMHFSFKNDAIITKYLGV